MGVGAALSLVMAIGAAGVPDQPGERPGYRSVSVEAPFPQIGLVLNLPRLPQAGVYRQIRRDFQTNPPIVGPYPAEALAARREGEVGLRLTIDTDGRVTDCSITEPSGERSLDAYSCPFVRASAHLSPALDDRGVRRGGVVTARLNYTLRMMTSRGDVGPRPFPDPIERQAQPLTPITAETLGLPISAFPSNHIDWFSVSLAIDSGGRVTACTMSQPTFLDRLDRRICDRLRHDVGFAPATGAEKQALASRCHLLVPWPHIEPPPTHIEPEWAAERKSEVSCRSSY